MLYVVVRTVALMYCLQASGDFVLGDRGRSKGSQLPRSETESEAAETMLSDNELLITQLEDRFGDLREKLTRVQTQRDVYRNIIWRLSRLEGTGCPSNAFRCGSDTVQCISELLVCDGTKDCKNGYDEDPAYCDTSKVSAGAILEGCGTFENTYNGGQFHMCHRAIVESVRRYRMLKSHLLVSTSSPIFFEGSAKPEKWIGAIRYQSANRRWIASVGHHRDRAGMVVQHSAADCQFTDDSFEELACVTSIKGSLRLYDTVSRFRRKGPICYP